MQRREQQRRAASGGPSGGSYLGGGVSGYSPVPQRYDAPPTPARTSSPAPSSLRPPAFKSGGMKLGSKKTTQSQLLDALGSEALVSEEMSVPPTPSPAPSELVPQREEPSSIPAVTPEMYVRQVFQIMCSLLTGISDSVHSIVRENIELELAREGGLNSLELKGEMNLQITDANAARVKVTLAQPPTRFGSELQFKTHPHVSRFAVNGDRVISLKDSSRSFPLGKSLAVLKWRYTGKDETFVPLSSKGYIFG